MCPRASTFTRTSLCTRPRSRSSSGVTSTPASKRSDSVSRLTTLYSSRNGLWKPRFGTRRCSGIWPPSKPRLCLKPERDFAPLWPGPAVLPWPDPWPRPTRFLACFAPLGGRRLLRFMTLLSDLDEVPNLQDHAARGRRVGQFDGVVQPPQPESLDDALLLLVEADGAL